MNPINLKLKDAASLPVRARDVADAGARLALAGWRQVVRGGFVENVRRRKIHEQSSS